MIRVWRRWLFRKVVIVRFAVAIAAAEGREARDSSQGDMDSIQTITGSTKESGWN